MIALGRCLLEVITQHRVAVASAVIAAIALIWVVHAPVMPVIAGCLLALAYILLRSRGKMISAKKDR